MRWAKPGRSRSSSVARNRPKTMEALAEQPSLRPPPAGSAEIPLTRAEWPAFDELVARLRRTGKGNLEAQTFAARKSLAHADFTSARRSIDGAIALDPRAIWPRVILTHVL